MPFKQLPATNAPTTLRPTPIPRTLPPPSMGQQQVTAVLEYATRNNVEPFLEPVLELCHTIITRDAREVEAGRSDGSLAAMFLDQAPVLLENCAHPDAPVSTAAAQCVVDLVGDQAWGGWRWGGACSCSLLRGWG